MNPTGDIEKAKTFKYFSTFTGIGGFELGIQNAHRETIRRKQADTSGNDEVGTGLVTAQGQNISAEGGRPSSSLANISNERPLLVGYSEIDKYADKVFQYHFKGANNYGDITKINADELPDFDCLVGGFPCQAFSIAGKRGGFEDTRGTLFFDLARILRAKQPRLFVFENVKGLLSHDNGQTFRTIIATIAELGYDAQWQVLNSKNHGVPQNRERIIIVGHLRGTPRPKVFPFGQTEGTYIDTDATEEGLREVAATQTARQYANWNGNFVKELTGNRPQTARVYDDEGISPTLNTMQGGQKQPKVVYKYRKDGEEAYMDTPHVSAIKASNQANQRSDGTSLVVEDAEIRRLTPLECERLQGFPDNWTEYGVELFEVPEGQKFSRVLHSSLPIPISDSQRYKMCGNAVTTNVIQAVFERVFM